MNTYKLKFSPDKMKQVLAVIANYGIMVLLSWKETDGFFSDYFYMIVSTLESHGVTEQEKDRIINEQLKNIIHSKFEV